MAPEATLPPRDVNVPGDYFSLAGFEVIMDGRFWVLTEESVASDLVHRNGGTRGFVYRHALKGFSARMSKAAAMALSRDARVEYVEEDGMGSVLTTQANPPYGLDRIDQRDLRNFFGSISVTDIHAYISDRPHIFNSWSAEDVRLFCGVVTKDGALTIGLPVHLRFQTHFVTILT